jgi:hypothetical protein
MSKKSEGGANDGGILGLLEDIYSSPYTTVLSLGLVVINTTQEQLHYLAESTKKRFPITVEPINFAINKATVITSTISKACLTTCENVKESANELKSSATDKAYVIRQNISNVEIKLKEKVLGAKGFLSIYVDRAVLVASDALLRAPATLEPVVLKTLEQGRPYVVHIVSIAKPYALHAFQACSPFIERLKPAILVYLDKLRVVVDSNPFWAENMDILLAKLSQAVHLIAAYCRIESQNEEDNTAVHEHVSRMCISADSASCDEQENASKQIWMDSRACSESGITTMEVIPAAPVPETN